MKIFTINEHSGHLGHVTCTICMYFPTSQGGSTRNLALIGRAVSEKKLFENNCNIHVCSPRAGADNPCGYFVFINTIIQLIKSFNASFPH